MKKGVKRGFVIGVSCILVLCVALFSIPYLFKKEIKEAVVNTANEKLNAKIHFDDFGLNMFSNFPNITISLDNVSVSGIGDFEGDTLVKAKSANATLNIIQLFKGNYEISKINLNSASVYAKVLKDGRVNWDITKSDSTSTVEEEVASTIDESSFNLKLQKISLDNCRLVYEDQESSMKIILADWSGEVSGDFSADNTTLKTKSSIGEVSFVMDGIPYLSKIKGLANATVDADMNNIKFTFVESDLQLNDVRASLDGSVAMMGEKGIDFDLRMKSPDTQFKDILSIVPAMYTDDFKNIKTSGTASLDGFVKGMMEGEQYPAFGFRLLINDAMFQYPSLPKSVNNINVDMNISSQGGSMDNTVIDISKFNFAMAGNPFAVSLNIQTPISDPNLKAHMKGFIDMAAIKDIYPLDKDTELNGKLTADLNIATRMSAIEKEQYQNVQASGSLKINDMTYRSKDQQDVVINNAGLDFSPQYVNLSSLNLRIGENDLLMTGRLENLIAYVLKDQTLKGQLSLNSKYFSLNDFMGDTPSSEMEAEDVNTATSISDHFVVPANIDFALNAQMDQVLYEKINITNLRGTISVKDGAIRMQNVSANALGGTAKVTGEYSTAADPNNPKVDLAINVDKASFAETFKSVESIQKFAPIFEKIQGSYSMNIDLNAIMGNDMMQMLGALTASGALQANDVKVSEVEALSKLSTALKTDALKSFTAKDINIPFTVKDGKVDTKPFTVNIGDGGKLTIGGVTGLDQSMDYKGTIALPTSMANNFVNTIPITIKGTFSDPKIGVDTKSLLGSITDKTAETLLGTTVSEKKEEVTAKLAEEKAKQIQNLRDNAKTSSDRLVDEAKKQAQKLVEVAEPKGAIAKIAAQKASERLVSEAEKSGQRLVDEAELQIKKLETQE